MLTGYTDQGIGFKTLASMMASRMDFEQRLNAAMGQQVASQYGVPHMGPGPAGFNVGGYGFDYSPMAQVNMSIAQDVNKNPALIQQYKDAYMQSMGFPTGTGGTGGTPGGATLPIGQTGVIGTPGAVGAPGAVSGTQTGAVNPYAVTGITRKDWLGRDITTGMNPLWLKQQESQIASTAPPAAQEITNQLGPRSGFGPGAKGMQRPGTGFHPGALLQNLVDPVSEQNVRQMSDLMRNMQPQQAVQTAGYAYKTGAFGDVGNPITISRTARALSDAGVPNEQNPFINMPSDPSYASPAFPESMQGGGKGGGQGGGQSAPGGANIPGAVKVRLIRS